MHDKEADILKGERHDPEDPYLLAEIRRLMGEGRRKHDICKQLGLAWRTMDRIEGNHGLTFKKHRRTDDQIATVVQRHGGLPQLIGALRSMREEGLGWQRMAELVELNRYACRVLVEEGRVPTFRSQGRERFSK